MLEKKWKTKQRWDGDYTIHELVRQYDPISGVVKLESISLKSGCFHVTICCFCLFVLLSIYQDLLSTILYTFTQHLLNFYPCWLFCYNLGILRFSLCRMARPQQIKMKLPCERLSYVVIKELYIIILPFIWHDSFVIVVHQSWLT